MRVPPPDIAAAAEGGEQRAQLAGVPRLRRIAAGLVNVEAEGRPSENRDASRRIPSNHGPLVGELQSAGADGGQAGVAVGVGAAGAERGRTGGDASDAGIGIDAVEGQPSGAVDVMPPVVVPMTLLIIVLPAPPTVRA